MNNQNQNEGESRKALIIFLFIFFIIFSGVSYLFYLGLQPNQDSNELEFCNNQGWGYSGSYQEESESIWCGALTHGEDYSFEGINYPVHKTWHGLYKVDKDFDINLYIKKQRFYKDCENECLIYNSPLAEYDFNLKMCYCYNVSNAFNTFEVVLVDWENSK